MKIWVNCIVENEDSFLWFSVTSIVNYVDKILIWDSGSTDNTQKIIKELSKKYGEKISVKFLKKVDKEEFSKLRNEMLLESECDWLMILDGDEVWWERSIKSCVDLIKNKGKELNGVVVPFYNSLGDIYHHQEESAGKYNILGKTGHLTLRFINRKIPGLKVALPYGHEGYYDKNNIPVQNLDKLQFLEAPFLHLTHLKRSSQKRRYDKKKYELGLRIKFEMPEVFYQPFPEFIDNPLRKRGLQFLLKSSVLEVPRKIKRRILK